MDGTFRGARTGGVMKVWCFCRSCGHRGQFELEPGEKVRCPECHKHHRPEAMMSRQDVEWMRKLEAQEGK